MITRVKPDIIYPRHTVNHWPHPVRDCTGATVPHITVRRDEMTCTQCGETTTEGWCYRCDDRPAANKANSSPDTLVPTLSYLAEGEYQQI